MHCVFNLDNIFSFCVLFNSSYSTRLRSSPLFRTTLYRLPAPLYSMGDGVVVAGSLSFQGHFHSLTPGSLSTVQTFTQSLLVRIAMNPMPLCEERSQQTWPACWSFASLIFKIKLERDLITLLLLLKASVWIYLQELAVIKKEAQVFSFKVKCMKCVSLIFISMHVCTSKYCEIAF